MATGLRFISRKLLRAGIAGCIWLDMHECVLIECMAVNPQSKHRWTPTATLLLLCFLLAIGAMRSDLFPDPSSSSSPQWGREALAFALLAAVAAAYAAARKSTWPRGRQLLSIILMSLALFVAPSLLMNFSQNWVSAFTRVALFSLVPIFAIVFEPYIGSASDSKFGSALLAALVSLVGMLCVFPVDIPNSIEAGAAFIAVIIAAAIVAGANCYAVHLANNLPPNALAPMAAIAGAVATFGLILTGAFTQSFTQTLRITGNDFAWSALVTLPGLLLLFWLLPHISATRITTRFLLAPLIAILISMAIDRPSVAPRIWLGLLLIATGAAGLLFAPNDPADTTTSTLNLHRE